MSTALWGLLGLLALYLLLGWLERRRRRVDTGLIPGLDRRTLRVKGRSRSYLLFTPPGQAEAPRPLIIVLHGGGGNADAILRRSGMHELARRHGFFACFPNGSGRGRRLNWNAGSSPPQGYAEERRIDDVAFLRALIRALREELPIDGARIYVAGLSKGGMLAYRFACEAPREVAAIAAVSATLTFERCRPRSPVPVLHIHGELDENVPIRGGRGRFTARKNDFPPVWHGIVRWLKINGCRDTAEETQPARDTSCWHYRDCANGAEVVFCLVRGSGHGWPGALGTRRGGAGGDLVSTHFEASETIYRFFMRHGASASMAGGPTP